MLTFIAALAVAVAAGTALGWALRSVTSWCPHCGEGLTCSACGRRPGLGTALNRVSIHATNVIKPSPSPGKEGPRA